MQQRRGGAFPAIGVGVGTAIGVATQRVAMGVASGVPPAVVASTRECR